MGLENCFGDFGIEISKKNFVAHVDDTSYNSTFVSHFSKEKVTILVKVGI